jgi:hypothetical protein
MNYNVERITLFERKDLTAWTNDRNIKFCNYITSKISGFNIVICEIKMINPEITHYVIERFDKLRFIMNKDSLLDAFCDIRDFSIGTVANIQVCGDDIVVLDEFVGVEYYTPTVRNIKTYLRSIEANKMWRSPKNKYVVRQTGMSIQHIEQLRAKLSLIGVPNMIVDINTLAVLKDNTIILYTCQSEIINKRV